MNKTLISKSGNVLLELRQDSASAWLTIKRSGQLVDEKEILDLIAEAGIKSGFEEAQQLIRERGIEKDFDTPFPIAVCQKETGNKEATLKYNFDPEAINQDLSQIDLGQLKNAIYVNSGDIVASYTDNLFERDGSIYDLFGALIDPPQVDEAAAQKLAGVNVRYEARDFIAEKTGYPYLDEAGRLCILDYLSLASDQIPTDETIRSPLTLDITGDLCKVRLICLKSLQLHGNIRDSSIYCEEDLTLSGAITACTNPGIQVLGKLKVSSIINSRICVKEGIEFDTEILNSIVACDGDILGQGEISRISGGLVQAAGNIEIAIAGSHPGVETEIEIAISPFYRSVLMQMTKEAVRLRSAGEESALDELQKQISRCESELDQQLSLFLKRPDGQKKSITVRDEVYPKTLFRVLKHSYQIKSRQTGICLVEKE
ncbi:MAG: uncharacterized protein PWP64_984 [Candidatus Cloacimonadota bacterium]|nr:uncharacterized protein [Candidatus Cloacimonadota bacterium]